MFPQFGGIFFDPSFHFPDGEQGEKLFIILGLSPADDYVVARTTSNPTHKSWKYGCHNDEPEPSFTIPVSYGVFPKDTWVCLDYLKDFDAQEFNKKVTDGQIIRKGEMPIKILKELMACAASSQDATRMQEKVLRDTLGEIG